MDIEIVKERYETMSDAELIRILTKDARDFTAEAQQIAIDEVEKRKLDVKFIEGLKAQNKTYNVVETDSLCEIIRDLNCPICQDDTIKLNAALISEVISYVFYTRHKKRIQVACPACLDTANNTALAVTLAFGWWHIPWGPIRTIQSVILNLESKKTNHIETPNGFLQTFVLANIGLIETYKNDTDKLQQLVS